MLQSALFYNLFAEKPVEHGYISLTLLRKGFIKERWIFLFKSNSINQPYRNLTINFIFSLWFKYMVT